MRTTHLILTVLVAGIIGGLAGGGAVHLLGDEGSTDSAASESIAKTAPDAAIDTAAADKSAFISYCGANRGFSYESDDSGPGGPVECQDLYAWLDENVTLGINGYPGPIPAGFAAFTENNGSNSDEFDREDGAGTEATPLEEREIMIEPDEDCPDGWSKGEILNPQTGQIDTSCRKI